jgi:beta-RFAP synthase
MPAAVEQVTVTVPGRLHVGFVDLNGELGRRFGSLGIALDLPRTKLTMARGQGLSAQGPDSGRALASVRSLLQHFGIEGGVHVRIDTAIPEHIGLGSGTQLSLGVGVAFARLFGLRSDPWALARVLHRGARSSIGIASFELGGVILDGGRGGLDRPPPVVSRLPFPEAWRVVLIFDRSRRGLHGSAEAEAFCRLPPFPPDRAAHLCRLVLMGALPALVEEDFQEFSASIAELQRITGDHFAPLQGGSRFSSGAVAGVLDWLTAEGIAGVGQSSWGPTGFALLESEADAADIVRAARRRWPQSSALSFAISQGRNHGGEVEISPALG